jgi:hypothetical protein
MTTGTTTPPTGVRAAGGEGAGETFGVTRVRECLLRNLINCGQKLPLSEAAVWEESPRADRASASPD